MPGFGQRSKDGDPDLDDVLFGDGPVDSPAMDQLKNAVLDADDLANRIVEMEASLKVWNEAHRKLTTQTIPSLMAELGELSEVKSSWGTVKLSPFWSGKITPETEARAFAWLDEHGHGGIVKREFIVPVMKGDDRHAQEVRGALTRISADYEEKQGVHHQTLQGFIRAMAKANTPVPQDLFNVYSGTVAKISIAKE